MKDAIVAAIVGICIGIVLIAALDFARIQRRALRSIQQRRPRGAAKSWEEFHRQVARGLAGDNDA